jgi:hypothetical protein
MSAFGARAVSAGADSICGSGGLDREKNDILGSWNSATG